MTEKQIWARRRNWLIMRLLGAKSIFSWDNMKFMEKTIGDYKYVSECEDAIDRLLITMRESTYKQPRR